MSCPPAAVILYPAIDIRDGKAVRLQQGDYARETAYDDDPVVAALRWAEDGARWLHVVDLDGARAGEPVNLDVVRRIVAAVEIPIQLGGGLRDSKKVEDAISAGVERVVLGTAAVRDPDVAAAIAAAHGDRVVAAVDARAGRVAAEGWTEPSAISPAELTRQLWERGVSRFIYTPVEVDGMMEGPDVESLREVAEASDGELIYSGGVGSLDDIRALAALEVENLGGVIVGRALYERRFGVAEAQAILGD
jgi:phosphoribosylformimino-5-aminoimidazole carboxamide ribotide isomerase